MKITKNKKSQEGAVEPMRQIIGWIILFALIIFVFMWYSGLGNKAIEAFKAFF